MSSKITLQNKSRKLRVSKKHILEIGLMNTTLKRKNKKALLQESSRKIKQYLMKQWRLGKMKSRKELLPQLMTISRPLKKSTLKT